MTSISIDASELRAYGAHLAAIPAKAHVEVSAIVQRGANNIKRQQQSEARASRHFKGFASAISYDMILKTGTIGAEIGPVKGAPGSLANIAYFGTSRGGGTVADPQNALDAEAPKFEKALGDFMERVLK